MPPPRLPDGADDTHERMFYGVCLGCGHTHSHADAGYPYYCKRTTACRTAYMRHYRATRWEDHTRR